MAFDLELRVQSTSIINWQIQFNLHDSLRNRLTRHQLSPKISYSPIITSSSSFDQVSLDMIVLIIIGYVKLLKMCICYWVNWVRCSPKVETNSKLVMIMEINLLYLKFQNFTSIWCFRSLISSIGCGIFKDNWNDTGPVKIYFYAPCPVISRRFRRSTVKSTRDLSLDNCGIQFPQSVDMITPKKVTDLIGTSLFRLCHSKSF